MMKRKTTAKEKRRGGKPAQSKREDETVVTQAVGDDGAPLVHPAAEMFPLMTGEAFEQLVADIKERGVVDAGTLDANGRILDGRNRARACDQLGIPMRWERYGGPPGGEVAYVLGKNVRRRHLTDDQRAAIA